MHSEVKRFLIDRVRHWVTKDLRVIEHGSLNINGTARQFVPHSKWVGVDLGPGDGVDRIGRFHDIVREFPGIDCVVSCEALEHDCERHESLRHAAYALRSGGILLLTCAGPGREEHGTHASDDAFSSPFTPEFYRNVTCLDFAPLLEVDWERLEIVWVPGHKDWQVFGVKK